MDKIKKIKSYPLAVFGIAILAFYLICPRLIVKTDDGHFLGIMSESGFKLTEWLKFRYETISGRTACEFLTMKLLSMPLIVWKISAALVWIFIVWFAAKLMSRFCESRKTAMEFAVCIPFAVLITCVNPAAFWFSGSMTYLFPLGMFIAAVAPCTFDLFSIKYRKIPLLIFSTLSGLLACSQEQTAALSIGFLAVLYVALTVKRKIKPYHFLPIPSCAVQAYLLFSSPGMVGRMETESSGFERFLSMETAEKLACGFSNFFAFSFMMAFVSFGLLVLVIALKLRELYFSKTLKIYRVMLACFAGLTFIGGNLLSFILKSSTPDGIFEKMFLHGEKNFLGIFLMILGAVMLVLICFSMLLIAKKERILGVSALICYLAGVCSAVILGFSSSIYASGQRVFFMCEMLTLFTGGLLFASLKNEKSVNVTKNSFACASLIMMFVNTFGWIFLEIPIMG